MSPDDPNLPLWGGAWLHLVRGQIHDTRGERALAIAEYRKIQNLPRERQNIRANMISKEGLEQPFAPSTYLERPMVAAAD